VIEHKDGQITGTVTDELGFLDAAPIKNAKLEYNKLTMETTVVTPDGELLLKLQATVAGDKIEGTWEIPDTGETGEWKIEKKK